MRQSESIKSLSVALVKAQAEVGGAVKGSKNDFFKSSYADLNAVLKEIKPVFAAHGLAVIQLPKSDENGVGVTTRVIHVSGEWIEDEFTLPLAKADPQAAGSAITYAKRYALKAMAGMADVDDDAEAAMFRIVDPYTEEQKDTYLSLLESGDALGFIEFQSTLSEEAKIGLHNCGEKGQKVKLKDQAKALEKEAHGVLDDIAFEMGQMALQGDPAATEGCEGMSETLKRMVYGRLSEAEKAALKTLRSAA